MNNKKNIIKIIILIVLLAILLNPGILPFSSQTINAIKADLAQNVGSVAQGHIGQLSIGRIISALVVVLAVWLINTLASLIFDNFRPNNARTITISSLIQSVIRYACVLVGIVWALTILGINLSVIFASLGILTLIIGFGAQSLIEDMVTGVFIIFENNYNIGDVIVLGDFRGTVKKIDIRTTTIQDGGGNIKIINNSDIRNIQNRSKNLSLAICDVGTAYEADIREIEGKLLPELPGIYERHKDVLKASPKYAGVQSLGDSSVVIRITCEVEEANIFAAQRILNREIKIIFDEKGIEIPFNQLDIHTK